MISSPNSRSYRSQSDRSQNDRLRNDSSRNDYSRNDNLRNIVSYSLLVIGTILVLFAALSIGASSVSFSQVIDLLQCQFADVQACQVSRLHEKIITDIRLPRTLLAMIAGTGLAIAGVVLQTITRNPLADPYLFGVSSGATFGAVLSFHFFPNNAFMLNVGAFAGGFVSVVMVLMLASGAAGRQVERLILSGVAISFLLSAATSLTLYFSEPDASATIIFWMMGSFTKAEWSTLLAPTTIVLVCSLMLFLVSPWLNAMLIGDETAHSLGIRVGLFRLAMLTLTSLITAVIVGQCGGIGFVGLMVPHIVRRFVGGELRKVIVATLLAGPIFMVIVDILCRILITNQELPVGIITAILGSSFFFIVMRRS